MRNEYSFNLEYGCVMLEVQDPISGKVYMGVLDTQNKPVACFNRDVPESSRDYVYARHIIEGAL